LNNYLGGIGESFKEFVAKKIKGGFDNRRMPLDLQPAKLNAEKKFERETDNLRPYSTEVFNPAKQRITFTKVTIRSVFVRIERKTS